MTDFGRQWSRYENRGLAGSGDWKKGDLTQDGQLHDLDCSALVPAGATAIVFRIQCTHNTVGIAAKICSPAATSARNCLSCLPTSSMIPAEAHGVIACDSARKVQYSATAVAWMEFTIWVSGWFKR